MEKIEIIKRGFEFLKEDCSVVLLAGFVLKSDIPDEATREVFDGGKFDHEYSLTVNDGFDEASFWGNIYLPFINDTYLKFEVSA